MVFSCRRSLSMVTIGGCSRSEPLSTIFGEFELLNVVRFHGELEVYVQLHCAEESLLGTAGVVLALDLASLTWSERALNVIHRVDATVLTHASDSEPS